jgi:hypothetical protein
VQLIALLCGKKLAILSKLFKKRKRSREVWRDAMQRLIALVVLAAFFRDDGRSTSVPSPTSSNLRPPS